MSGNTAFNLINVFIALILNIVLNFILIPQYGIIGAAAGSIFVFKGKYRAVLINYPTREQKINLCEKALDFYFSERQNHY